MPAISFIPDQPAAHVHTSLRLSLKAMNNAQKCAVLWFAEVMRRRLYRDLGHSSINQYAMQELGFSKSRTRDFVRLAGQLDKLPAVREAMTKGELGYTKARELVSVATPETEDTWLKAARGTRKELVHEVKKAKRAAKVDPGQGALLPEAPSVVAPMELPVRFQMDLTPEQEARRAALVERLHKLGGVPNDKAELILEALAALVESVESKEKGPGGPSPADRRCRFMCMKPRGKWPSRRRPASASSAWPRPPACAAMRRFATKEGETSKPFHRASEEKSWPATSTAARPRAAAGPAFWRSITSSPGSRAVKTNRKT